MNESYDVNSVIIGKIYVCKQLGNRFGFIETKTNEYYLFYRQGNLGKQIVKSKMVREVFTEDEYEIYTDSEKTNNHVFNRPYIVDIEPIIPYLTRKEKESGQISKWRMVEIYNKVNFKPKTKKKTKETIA